MDFEWQKDDEEQFAAEETTPRPRLPRRHWPWLVLLLIIAVGGALLLRQEANRRLAESEAAVAEQVRAGHELARQAAADKDEELFRSLLSGRSKPWLETQVQALAAERLFARRALPLGLAPQGAGQIEAIELDPGLREAVVIVRQPYTLSNTAGVSQTVSLAQRYLYRKGERHWLLSPPLEPFWGPAQRETGQILSLRYRQRDEALARRLARDLDEALVEFCELPGVTCPPEPGLAAELATDPAALSTFGRVEEAVAAPEPLALPSPALLGEPLGDAGYRVLLRGYAAPLLANLLARAHGYGCCRGSLFFSALLQKQMSRLDLAPWPLDPVGYEEILDQGIEAATARTLFQVQDPALPPAQAGSQWQRALALVDFLEGTLGPSRLVAEGNDSLQHGQAAYGDNPDAFAVAWLEFIYARSRSGQSAGPSLPSGSLAFSCRSDSGENWLLAYEFAGQTWSELIRVRPPEPEKLGDTSYVNVRLLPAEQGGFLIQEGQFSRPTAEVARETRRVSWLPAAAGAAGPEEAITVYEWHWEGADEENLTSYISHSPGGRYLVLATYDVSTASPPLIGPPVWLVDLERCTAGTCPREEIPGVPSWSPSGGQTLLVAAAADGSRTLYHADERGQNGREIGAGYNPFWLDEARYGYFREPAAAGTQELVLATVGQGQQSVVRAADFLAVMPAADRPQALRIDYAWANTPVTVEPGQLVVLASGAEAEDASRSESGSRSERQAPTHIFSLAVDGGGAVAEIHLLFTIRERGFATTSPDGRWLVVHEYGQDFSQMIRMLDLEEDRMRSLGEGRPGPWSPAGQWLPQAHDLYFLLRSPEEGYKHLVTHDLAGCRPDRWLER